MAISWTRSSRPVRGQKNIGQQAIGRRLTDNTELAELLLNDGVVGDGDSLTVNLGVASLVDKLSDSLEVNLTVGDVRVDKVEHLLGGLGDTNEDTVVDLKESEKLEDLLGLGGNLRDTMGSVRGRVSNSKKNERTP